MPLNTEKKHAIIQKHQQGANDTGSSEVQIALLSTRINELTEHLKIHKHDFHSTRGLMKLVGRRKRLMRYLEGQDLGKYRALIQELGIRG